jgi:aerobic-type carbon monoxide dehydrogenase small subunit (CoxS/CutS family)
LEKISFTLNGKEVEVTEPDRPLIYALRNDCNVKSVRYGCGLEQCGCCVVLINGSKQYACTLPTHAVANKSVETVEGLSTSEEIHPIQQAFLDEQAGQCGYCLSGMIMATKGLLARNSKPTRAEIVDALDNHLCRCGAHSRIIRAVQRASDLMS